MNNIFSKLADFFRHPEVVKTIKVGLWSVASAVVSSFVMPLLSLVHVPVQYLFIVSFVNTALVALKKFIEWKIQQVPPAPPAGGALA